MVRKAWTRYLYCLMLGQRLRHQPSIEQLNERIHVQPVNQVMEIIEMATHLTDSMMIIIDRRV